MSAQDKSNRQLGTCELDRCQNEATQECKGCKQVYYCSRRCKKNDWTEHKDFCRTGTKKPPTESHDKNDDAEPCRGFMSFPKEIRDQVSYFPFVDSSLLPTFAHTHTCQIYHELLVARFTKAQKARYDRAVATPQSAYPDPMYHRQAIVDLEQLLMCTPGGTIDGKSGFKPLADASGLLRANKQIWKEAISVFWSGNTFVSLIDAGSTYTGTAQIFDVPVDPAHIAKIRHLRLVVQDLVVPEMRNRDMAVRLFQRNTRHMTRSIDTYCHNLESLTVHYVSAYMGQIQLMRRDIDALQTHPKAQPVMLQRGTDNRIDTLARSNFRTFFVNQFNFADAMSAMQRTVKHFDISGDLPGEVITRPETKFGTQSTVADEEEAATTTADVHAQPPRERLDNETGQRHNDSAAFFRDLAARNPEDEYMADLARRIANRPVYSPSIQAMLFGPPTPEEMAMLEMGAPGGRRGRGWR